MRPKYFILIGLILLLGSPILYFIPQVKEQIFLWRWEHTAYPELSKYAATPGNEYIRSYVGPEFYSLLESGYYHTSGGLYDPTEDMSAFYSSMQEFYINNNIPEALLFLSKCSYEMNPITNKQCIRVQQIVPRSHAPKTEEFLDSLFGPKLN